MRLLVIHDVGEGKSSGERFVLFLSSLLNKYPEWEVAVCLFVRPVDDPFLELHYPGLVDLAIHRYYIPCTSGKPLKNIRPFWQIAHAYNPWVIHQWSEKRALLSLGFARWYQIKSIFSLPQPGKKNFWPGGLQFVKKRLAFALANYVVAPARAGLQGQWVAHKKSRCLLPGIDIPAWAYEQEDWILRQSLGLGDKKVVGMMSQFDENVDFPSFLQAAMQVLDTREDVVFLAMGQGMQLGPCKAMVPQSYQDRIIFTGFLEDPYPWIHLLDIGVMMVPHGKIPSQGCLDQILTYMALGKPVLASGKGNFNGILLHGQTGCYVPSQSRKKWVESLNYFLDHPEEAQNMGKEGYIRWQYHFDVSSWVRRHMSLYMELSLEKSQAFLD